MANPSLKERAVEIADTFSGDIEAVPMFHSYMAMSIGKLIDRGFLVKAWKTHPDADSLKKKLWNNYMPDVDLALLDPKSGGIMEKSEGVSGSIPSEVQKQILACTDSECLKPAYSGSELLKEIGFPQ